MEEGRVHPDCINSSNPYHECVEFCFRKIAEDKEWREREEQALAKQGGGASTVQSYSEPDQNDGVQEENSEGNNDNVDPVDEEVQEDYAKLTGRQKRLFELRLKMNEARKANQSAMVAEKKKIEAPQESRGISKQKFIEERKKKIGKLLDANGLDMTKAYMLDTQEVAETKYKKWEKDPAPHGWDVFNQKTLYNAYKKRTKNIDCNLEEYNKMKEADPEFYREASSLQYGKAPKTSENKIDKMVKELQDRHLVGEGNSMTRKTSTRSMTAMSISIRRLREHSVNTHWRSRTIWRGELLCQTKCQVQCTVACIDLYISYL